MKTIGFELPTEDEMDLMTINELTYWKNRLKPYYQSRFDYKSDEYLKCLKYLWFNQMIENINQGIDRWNRVAKRQMK